MVSDVLRTAGVNSLEEISVKKSACLTLRRLTWIPVLSTAALLSACYVVPINPQTGQPYPMQPPVNTAVVPPPVNPNVILQAKLYPLNPQATKAGALIATASDFQNGRGVFTVNFMGETLQGDASRVDANYPFGRIYREVLGSVADVGKGGRRGIANAIGPNGTSMQCEYQMTSNDIGTGVCLLSNGAKYQMHFGS